MYKMSINEGVRQAKTENVELIEVPVPGDSITLLRAKEMPEYAFVLWTSRKTSTMSQLFLHDVDQKFTVTCACCDSETYGLTPPEKEEEHLKWKNQMIEQFRNALTYTAFSNGIHTLFMRKAGSWNDHYGQVSGLRIVEAYEHIPSYKEFYNKDDAKRHLSFIDYDQSEGLDDYR